MPFLLRARWKMQARGGQRVPPLVEAGGGSAPSSAYGTKGTPGARRLSILRMRRPAFDRWAPIPSRPCPKEVTATTAAQQI